MSLGVFILSPRCAHPLVSSRCPQGVPHVPKVSLSPILCPPMWPWGQPHGMSPMSLGVLTLSLRCPRLPPCVPSCGLGDNVPDVPWCPHAVPEVFPKSPSCPHPPMCPLMWPWGQPHWVSPHVPWYLHIVPKVFSSPVWPWGQPHEVSPDVPLCLHAVPKVFPMSPDVP